MKFHLQLDYQKAERENALNLLHAGGLNPHGPVKIEMVWVAVQTCTAFALVETTDPKAMYELCSRWSDVGKVTVTPVLSASSI